MTGSLITDIQSKLYDSGSAGPRLVVFGAIHGDESCGTVACERVAHRIESGQLRLESGSLHLVPVCNPEAYAKRARFVEENLNRVFARTEEPVSYEAKLANVLCDILDEGADLLLDLHSTSAPGPTSAFVDHPTDRTTSFAASLCAEYVLLDWPTVYAANGHGFRSDTTLDYAERVGISAVTYECGQHDDPASADVAELAILRALAFSGIAPRAASRCDVMAKSVRMLSVEKKNAEADSLTRNWQHLEPVQAGTAIATRADGSQIRVPNDSIVLLPKHNSRLGEEWFYIGEAV